MLSRRVYNPLSHRGTYPANNKKGDTLPIPVLLSGNYRVSHAEWLQGVKIGKCVTCTKRVRLWFPMSTIVSVHIKLDMYRKVSPAGAPVLRTYPRGGQSGLSSQHCWSGKTNTVLVKVFLFSNKVKTLCPLSPHENYLCKHLLLNKLIG